MKLGPNENAFKCLFVFHRAAKKAGLSDEEIKATIEEAKRGDYKHLRKTLGV